MYARWCGRTFFFFRRSTFGGAQPQGKDHWAKLLNYTNIKVYTLAPWTTFIVLFVCLICHDGVPETPFDICLSADRLAWAQSHHNCVRCRSKIRVAQARGQNYGGGFLAFHTPCLHFFIHPSMKLYRCVAVSKMKASFKTWVLSNL